MNDPGKRRLGRELFELLRRFEGWSGKAYRCPAGVWTIGYGHTSKAGPPPVKPGDTVSREGAELILRADAERMAEEVARLVKVPLTTAQFSALVSFAFNVGIGNFRGSSVLAAVNRGDFDAVPRRLMLWVKADGHTLPGLVKRRAAEAELFAGHGSDEIPRNPDVLSPSQGKAPRQSSTIAAALLSAIAALAAASKPGTIITAVLLLIVIAASGWIIRERLRKRKMEGI